MIFLKYFWPQGIVIEFGNFLLYLSYFFFVCWIYFFLECLLLFLEPSGILFSFPSSFLFLILLQLFLTLHARVFFFFPDTHNVRRLTLSAPPLQTKFAHGEVAFCSRLENREHAFCGEYRTRKACSQIEVKSSWKRVSLRNEIRNRAWTTRPP